MQRRQSVKVSALAAVIASLLILSTSIPVKSTSMDTILSPNENEAVVRYESVQVLNIKYPNGGDIGTKLAGQNIQIEFNVDSSDPSMQTLMKDMNAYLLRERESTATVSDLVIDYRGQLKGLKEFAALSHKLTVKMKITGYVMGELQNERTGKLIDLNWRTFIISQAVFVKTEEYGVIDINRPSGFIAATMPTLLKALATEGTLELLNKPALDFSKLAIPMDQWRWDYDSDERVTVVVTAGTIGRILQGEEQNVTFEHQGVLYGLELSIPPPSGTIQFIGFAEAFPIGDSEAAIVYEEPTGVKVNLMAVQILLALGGVMAAIAIVVLLKARK